MQEVHSVDTNITNSTEFPIQQEVSEATIRDRNSIIKIRNGDAVEEDKLVERYQNCVYAIASPYFLPGAEKKDIIQEGMLGLHKAILNFDLDKNVTFDKFAKLCIKSQILSAVKTYNRQKHSLLNSSLSLNTTVPDEDDSREMEEKLCLDTSPDPLETITRQETYFTISKKIPNLLSSFEKEVYYRFLNGFSYTQMAQALNTHEKAIDNALQRIRKKVENHLEKEEKE